MGDEDAELVALSDNELDRDARSRLLARLEEDTALRKRYERLQKTDGLVTRAMDDLLNRAPLDRLRAAMLKAEASPIARWRAGATVLPFAAGIVVGFLAAGIAAWAALTLAPQEEREDWRTAVVEYMQLYTNQTFALDDTVLSSQEKKLNAIGEKLKLDLAPETLAVPGLRFRAAQLLEYDGAPLAEIVYVNPQGAPVLFCIIADAGPDLPSRSETRGDLSLTSWSNGGRGYLVIGRLPEHEIAELAQTLQRRFSKA
jgi:anti-sigma factor RsiW